MGLLNLLKKSKSASRRVAVIGLAGLSCSLIKQLSANGHLPCISRLLDEGFCCEMESAMPPVPAVAWTTCMTGVNPAKHGIFGFMDRRRESYGVYFPNAAQVAAPALWDLLTAAGKKTLAVNIPQTYPAREINGIMISGFVADDFEKAVYPRRLVAPLREINYRIDVAGEYAADNRDGFFKDFLYVLTKRRETFTYLADKVNWDLFVGVFTGTGPLLKYFLTDFNDPASACHAAILDCFHELDRTVGGIVEKLDRDTALLMLSDHGSAPCAQEVYLNAWLRNEGLLHFLNDPPASFEDIDPERTKAFVLDPGRVYINQKGSMPAGSVASGQEYERVLKTLTEGFLSIKDQKTSETVISRVFRKNELFSGPLALKAPDLVLWGAKGYDLKGDIIRQDVFGNPGSAGMSTYNDAFFYMRGLSSLNAKPAIRDIAPTVLKLLQIPVPADMDGKSLI